jgi:RNA polymerase sigma-70 factor (ECF subfamily)
MGTGEQMPTDLVERAQEGDEDAFNRLAAMTVDRAYAVAYRILRDTTRAEDAAQHALLTAWRRLPTLRDPARFDAWFHRILVNACRDEGRRGRSWESKLHLVEPTAIWEEDATVMVADRDELERAFARLTVDHRSVLVLRHYLAWTIDEIAEAMTVPAGTVSSRLHYGMAALRAAIESGNGQTEQASEARA